MKSVFSLLRIVALIASTRAYVEEYSKSSEAVFDVLKEEYNDIPAELINSMNKLQFKKVPEVITGDTILFEATSIYEAEYPKRDESCGRYEGIRIGDCQPYCKITHFGFKFTGAIPTSEKGGFPKAGCFPGFINKTSSSKSASGSLLNKFISDNCDKTYLEIILLFKNPHSQGPSGVLLDVPVFVTPAKYAKVTEEELREWAEKEARVGVSPPIKLEPSQKLHDLEIITTKNLEWLKELLSYNVHDVGFVNTLIRMYASRPLLLSRDTVKSIMKLAKKYLTRNRSKSETPIFSISFIAEVYRRLSHSNVNIKPPCEAGRTCMDDILNKRVMPT